MELEETHKNNNENVGKHARTHKLRTIRHVGLLVHVIKQKNRWSRPIGGLTTIFLVLTRPLEKFTQEKNGEHVAIHMAKKSMDNHKLFYR